MSHQLRTAPEERSLARLLLLGKGLAKQSFAGRDMELEQGFRDSMRTLAQPELGLRLSVSTPGHKSVSVPLYAAGETVALGSFEQLLFCVGPPLKISDFVAALTQDLQNTDSSQGTRRIGLLPFQVRSSTIIWRAYNKRATDKIRTSDAVSALSRASLNPEQASVVISCLLKTGFLEESDGWLVLKSVYRECMDLIWSGYLIEIEQTTFSGSVTPDEPRNATKRFLFVGPPGRRLLCTHLTFYTQKQKSASTKSGQPADSRSEQLVAFIRVSNAALERWINGLIRGTTGLAQAQGQFPDSEPTNEPRVPTPRTVAESAGDSTVVPLRRETRCPKCSAISEPGSLFCSECGGDLSASIRAKSTLPPTPRCPKCAEPVESASTFCGNCGQRLAASTHENHACRECGTSLSDDDMFCPNCGRRVREEEATQQ